MIPRGQDDLVRNVSLAWESVITNENCEKLVLSIPDRIAEVIENRGGPTRFWDSRIFFSFYFGLLEGSINRCSSYW